MSRAQQSTAVKTEKNDEQKARIEKAIAGARATLYRWHRALYRVVGWHRGPASVPMHSCVVGSAIEGCPPCRRVTACRAGRQHSVR